MRFPNRKDFRSALWSDLAQYRNSSSILLYIGYSYNNEWVLGSMNANGEHNNYGTVDSPDLDNFIAWIFNSNKQKTKKVVS